VSEDSPDKMEYSRRSRARACLRASKRGNFVGNQRFLKRYVGRKTKGDKALFSSKRKIFEENFSLNLCQQKNKKNEKRDGLFGVKPGVSTDPVQCRRTSLKLM
jgi:hypothetical protein